MPQGHDIESMTVVKRQYRTALKQIGSLGGGSHFIELQRDVDGYLWVMLTVEAATLENRCATITMRRPGNSTVVGTRQSILR